MKIASVDCPSDVKVKKGDTFNCKATTSSGQTANVKVTQQDDKGNVKYQVGLTASGRACLRPWQPRPETRQGAVQGARCRARRRRFGATLDGQTEQSRR